MQYHLGVRDTWNLWLYSHIDVTVHVYHKVNLMYYLALGITDTPNYLSGYSEQAKNLVSN